MAGYSQDFSRWHFRVRGHGEKRLEVNSRGKPD